MTLCGRVAVLLLSSGRVAKLVSNESHETYLRI